MSRHPTNRYIRQIMDRDDLDRYARHILLKEIGGQGQKRLRAARIALVGLGGLGAPAALYLAAAGIGTLRLIDDDSVSLSNLQRQILFRTADLGRLKVEVGAEALAALNPGVTLDLQPTRLGPHNARDLLDGADLILDGCDDFATRFAVNDASRALGIPLVSAAVGRWDGQVAVFNADAAAPCYRCLVPEIPPDAEPCARQGIVGALTGIVGAFAALEAIKLAAGAGRNLSGRLFILDALGANARTVALAKDPACSACGAP
jgi:molybdopterin/thiamine biosynthesis adenylyltransferase